METSRVIFGITFTILSPVFGIPIYYDDNYIDDTAADLSYLGSRVFSQPDFETGKKLETWNESSFENPEELGAYAEGDILFPARTRNGLISNTFRWPNGEVPYEITGSYSASDLSIINRAMDIYKKYTCITFRRKTSRDKDYISIVNGKSGCWSSVGRIGGRQEVNLQNPSCTTKLGTALHELMHAVGFLHEQSRFDRDQYITVLWQNIKSGHEGNFNLAEKDKTDAFGVNYDYRSVMHYSSKAFSTNGEPTLVPKDKRFMDKIGQREGFSFGDITKLNAMYNCPEKTQALVNNTGTFPNGTKPGTGTTEKEPPRNIFNLAVDLFSLFIH